MAAEQAVRVSPGMYRINGKLVKGATREIALKNAGIKAGTKVAAPAPAAPVAQQPAAVVPPTAKSVANEQLGLSSTLIDKGMDQLKDPNSQIGQAFAPTTAARLNEGDTLAQRKAVEDSLYQKYTRNMAQNKATDTANLEQKLYNRGIPLDPNAQQYKRNVDMLNQNYADQDLQARIAANTGGLQEQQGLVGINETVIGNQFDQAQRQRQQQMSDISGLQQGGSVGVNDSLNQQTTAASIDALKKKTPAEIALLNAQARRSGAASAPATSNNSPFAT